MPEVPQTLRILDIILGIIAIILGAFFFILPGFVVVYGLGLILGIGLILLGIWRNIKIFLAKELSMQDRMISIVIGLLMLIFGGLFIAAPSFFPTLLVYIFSGAVLIISILLLVQGAMGKELEKWTRIIYIIFGIIAIIIAVPAFILPATWGIELVSIAVSIALIFFGTLRLLIGITGDYT